MNTNENSSDKNDEQLAGNFDQRNEYQEAIEIEGNSCAKHILLTDYFQIITKNETNLSAACKSCKLVLVSSTSGSNYNLIKHLKVRIFGNF